MSSEQHILVVDDDQDVRDVTSLLLSKANFRVSTVASARECFTQLSQEGDVDLVLLDVMMPGMNGLELLQAIRLHESTSEIPVILHSSIGEEDVVVKGLELGADDYITKQTSPRLKLSRIRATLRRTSLEEDEEESSEFGPSLQVHELELYPEQRTLKIHESLVPITTTEYRILYALMTRPGSLLTTNELLTFVRKEVPEMKRNEIERNILALRTRLGNAGRHIEKVLGVGYRLSEEE